MTATLRYGPLAPAMRVLLLALPLVVLAIACATMPVEALPTAEATSTPPAPTVEAVVRPMRVVVTITLTPPTMCRATGHANVRACPGMDCDVVAWLRPGQAALVVTPGSWTQIADPDGYVWAALCEEATK
jgi:hypothetical protein